MSSPSIPRSPKLSPRMSRVKFGINSVPQQIGRPQEERLPNGPHPNLARTLGAQVLVEEVTSIMKENVKSLVDREGKLEDLESRATKISESSKIFEKTTHKVQQTFWKQNTRLIIISSVISFIIVVLIAGILYETLR